MIVTLKMRVSQNGLKVNVTKHLILLLFIGLIIFSCSDQSSETNSPDINSPNQDCGVDTTFTLDRLDFVIVRSPNCTYTTYGYGGIEMIDELGNVIWSAGGSRTSPYSMNTTSDGGYIFTFTSYVSRSSGPEGDINWSSELPPYQATHYVKDAIQTSEGIGEFFLAMRRFFPDFKTLDGTAKVTIGLKDFPASTASTSKYSPFSVVASSTKFDTRARGRYANVKIENESAGEKWRYGTFQVDVQADGRR